MNNSLVVDENRPDAPTDDDDLYHIVCDLTNDWSLCGKDVSNEPWATDGSDDEPCLACDDFAVIDFCGHCAMGGEGV